MDSVIVDIRSELPAFHERLGHRRCGEAPFPSERKLKMPARLIKYEKEL